MTTKADSRSAEPEAFFEGFAWPVPRAFAAAIAQLRFEQGDVLYRDRRGYRGLRKSIPKDLKALQVLHPPRSARVAGLDGDGDRRRTSWEGEVVVELVDVTQGKTDRLSLTQGKLFTALWRGDESWLDPEREEPEPPRTARELQGRLEEVASVFDEDGFPGPRSKGCRFLFVVDESSDSSRAKAGLIADALAATGSIEERTIVPGETSIEAARSFHPALVVRGLWMPRRSEAEVQASLRSVLYGGSASRNTGAGTAETEEGDSTSETDRFSLSRHGLLEVR